MPQRDAATLYFLATCFVLAHLALAVFFQALSGQSPETSSAVMDVAIVGPRVSVRWRADISASDREARERRFDLRGGEQDGNSPGTWRYELGSRSRENVAALLSDPAVEDTHEIDRETLTVPRPGIRVGLRPLPRLRP